MSIHRHSLEFSILWKLDYQFVRILALEASTWSVKIYNEFIDLAPEKKGWMQMKKRWSQPEKFSKWLNFNTLSSRMKQVWDMLKSYNQSV